LFEITAGSATGTSVSAGQMGFFTVRGGLFDDWNFFDDWGSFNNESFFNTGASLGRLFDWGFNNH
jgi:hypothetical protein